MAQDVPPTPSPRPQTSAARPPTRPRRKLPGWLKATVAVFAAGIPWLDYRTSSDVRDRNAHRLYADMLWTAVFSAAAAFNGAFALRLGASNELIGLLTSAPPFVVALLTIPFSRLVERTSNHAWLIARSVFAHRAGYLLVALLPFVVVTGRAEAFVAVIVVMTIPAALVNISFTSTFAEIVPEDRRATVVSVRAILASAVVMCLTPLFGHWLDLVGFPANYQALYLAGFVTSMLAVVALGRFEVPIRAARPATLARPGSGRSRGRFDLAATWRLFADETPFARIVIDTLAHGLGAWLVAPLYIIYYVKILHATDGWIGTFTALASLSAALGYYIWRRVITRWGEGWPLRVTIPASGLFPLLVGLSGNLNLILVFAVLNGLIQPGAAIAHFNTLLRVCPNDRRPTFLAVFTTIMNTGAFVAPLIGVALASAIGINAALFVGAGIWICGGLLFTILPVRPKPAH